MSTLFRKLVECENQSKLADSCIPDYKKIANSVSHKIEGTEIYAKGDSIIIKERRNVDKSVGQVIIAHPNIAEFTVENLSGHDIGVVGWTSYREVSPSWKNTHETWFEPSDYEQKSSPFAFGLYSK